MVQDRILVVYCSLHVSSFSDSTDEKIVFFVRDGAVYEDHELLRERAHDHLMSKNNIHVFS